jgi:hypothetical protein
MKDRYLEGKEVTYGESQTSENPESGCGRME